jgi:hypothetical protein
MLACNEKKRLFYIVYVADKKMLIFERAFSERFFVRNAQPISKHALQDSHDGAAYALGTAHTVQDFRFHTNPYVNPYGNLNQIYIPNQYMGLNSHGTRRITLQKQYSRVM